MYKENNHHYLGPLCEVFVMLLILYESIYIFKEINPSSKADVERNLILLFFVILMLFTVYFILKILEFGDDMAIVVDTIFIVAVLVINKLKKYHE